MGLQYFYRFSGAIRLILPVAFLWVCLSSLNPSYGCGDQADAAKQAVASPITFVGTVPADGSALAAVINAKPDDAGLADAVVYVCDGAGKNVWYHGFWQGNALHAISAEGSVIHATLNTPDSSGNSPTVAIHGAITTADGQQDFSAPFATGPAGLFFVEQSLTGAQGVSADGSRLAAEADTSHAASGEGTEVAGMVTPLGDGEAVNFQGSAHLWGEATGPATWIVQADGEVKGGSQLCVKSNDGLRCANPGLSLVDTMCVLFPQDSCRSRTALSAR